MELNENQFKYNDKEQRLMDAVSKRRNTVDLYYRGSGGKPGGHNRVVAVKDGEVIGKINWWSPGDDTMTGGAGVWGFSILPEHRNGPVATALIQAANSIHQKQGFSNLDIQKNVSLSQKSNAVVNKMTGRTGMSWNNYDFLGTREHVTDEPIPAGILSSESDQSALSFGDCPVHNGTKTTACSTCGNSTTYSFDMLGKPLKQVLNWE